MGPSARVSPEHGPREAEVLRWAFEAGSMPDCQDSVLRAMTLDGSFRVITIASSTMVQGVLAAQRVPSGTASRFAELLTGSNLVRETMAPDLRVQVIAKGRGARGSLIADSRPDGATRGLAQGLGPGERFELGAGSSLQVLRSLPSGAIHQGVVDVSAAGGFSEALMVYMQESEQVVSVIAVGALEEEGHVVRAGGYIVQLLPEAERAMHAIMTERLASMPNLNELLLEPAFSPAWLAGELLYGMPFSVLEESPVRYACGCGEETVLGALATLGRSDLEELLRDGNVLEISCDFCGREYGIDPERLRSLLDAS